MAGAVVSQLPIEVELVLEVMPCLAMRQTYDSAQEPHPCSYFREWGLYHSYDYKTSGPPAQPNIEQPAVYAGKRQVVPELLSGCRKSPILCVGINPNLPGWGASSRNAIHPYFEDVLQYAHYFRYRTQDKLQIPEQKYETLLGTAADSPASASPLTDSGVDVPVERAPVLMYEQYQTLLDGLAVRKGWQGHKLKVGEDISYANMVACPSARWVVTPNSDDLEMPVMGVSGARGIVGECFYQRRYFLRQLFQSLPAVILVFSRTTAREFISALQQRFSLGDPRPEETLADLFRREIRLKYGTLSDGTVLDARVIFMPHASANPEDFAQLRDPCVDRLVEEVDRGNLELNVATGHLARRRGACVFCTNSLYRIGRCDYENELRPLATGLQPLSADPAGRALADKAEQLRLLTDFTKGPSAQPPVFPTPTAATAGPRMVLKGKVVTMAGAVIDDGAIYISGSRIEKVQTAGAAAPAGFGSARVVDTNGVIYPGLLDLHNHLPYNILPLWKPPRRFDNRDEWRRRPEYRRDVSEPMKVIVDSGQNAIKAVIRYIEVKLLLGGVTAGQGMRSIFGGTGFYHGLVRNFEQPDDDALVAAGSRLPNLTEKDVPAMKRGLDTGNPYFFHLAEGLDAAARQQYMMLEEHELLRRNLIGIHSLALWPKQHRDMARAKAHVVWSPLSNMLLYGKTIDPETLRDSGSLFGLGSDWTPSGSRNILQELKVAWLCAQEVQDIAKRFGFEDLVHAVTINSARAAGWAEHVGALEAEKLADLLVLDSRVDDPFENLVRGTERDVQLVVVDGVARHGDTALMGVAGLGERHLEALTIGNRPKALDLSQPESPLGNLTFGQARARLEAAMSDLNRIRNAPEPLFEPLSAGPRLEIELDMQAEDLDLAPQPLASLPPLGSVPLDAYTVIDDPEYFDRLEAIEHLPAFLKGPSGLRKFYPR